MTIHEDTKLQKFMSTNMFEEWELKLDENSDNIITNTLYNNNATPEDIFYNGKCNCNTGLCVFKKIVFNMAYFHIKRLNLDINDICISYNLKGVSDVQISEKAGKSLLLTTFTYMDDLQNPSAFTYIDKHNYKFKNDTSFPLFLCRSKKYKHISLDSTTSYHCMNFKAYNNNKYSDMLIIKLWSCYENNTDYNIDKLLNPNIKIIPQNKYIKKVTLDINDLGYDNFLHDFMYYKNFDKFYRLKYLLDYNNDNEDWSNCFLDWNIPNNRIKQKANDNTIKPIQFQPGHTQKQPPQQLLESPATDAAAQCDDISVMRVASSGSSDGVVEFLGYSKQDNISTVHSNYLYHLTYQQTTLHSLCANKYIDIDNYSTILDYILKYIATSILDVSKTKSYIKDVLNITNISFMHITSNITDIEYERDKGYCLLFICNDTTTNAISIYQDAQKYALQNGQVVIFNNTTTSCINTDLKFTKNTSNEEMYFIFKFVIESL
jgi:hypothetical protein